MTRISVKRLKSIRSHAEYGGRFIANLTENDLSKSGDWQGSFDELKNDIAKHGITNPLILDKYESGELTLGNGHHRAVIAMELNLEYVPVRIRE